MAVADIITTPVTVYRSAVGATLPDENLAAGDSWPAGWTQFGYTSEPLSVDLKREAATHEIEQSLGVVGHQAKSEAITIETTLAEFTGANFGYFSSGSASAVAATAGSAGYDLVTGGDFTAMTAYQWGFEGSYVSALGNTHPVRFFLYRGVATFGGKLEFGKENPVGIPLHIESEHDMTKSAGQRLYKIMKVTAPHT